MKCPRCNEEVKKLEDCADHYKCFEHDEKKQSSRPVDRPVCEHGKQMSEKCTEGKCDRGRWVS